MPDCTTVADIFWGLEQRHGYDEALKQTSEWFDITEDQAEELIMEDDELNNGNF